MLGVCDKDTSAAYVNGFWVITQEELEAFAKLMAEHEREACALIADSWVKAYPHPSKFIAETIRLRG